MQKLARSPYTISEEEIQSLIRLENFNPHHLLGIHSLSSEKKIIRLWRPGANEIFLAVKGKIVQAEKIHDAGLFALQVSSEITGEDYLIYHQNSLLARDPYSFLPSISELDQYLFGTGVHYQVYNIMGGRILNHYGCEGVRFTVWAPSAKSVSLVADFNHWDGRINPMRSLGQSGIWEIFIPSLKTGEKYKFEIKTQSGELRLKTDPYAYGMELRPRTASVVANLDLFKWEDDTWMQKRKEEKNLNKPLIIYEVHLGSWRKEEGKFKNYRTLAHELAQYCHEMGFTHIELLPILEHPLDESWGYQVSGYFAATSRYGKPEDFQYFVNHLHKNGIGVFLDWVPGHFPTDDFSLARFDGTHLYEHADPRKGMHPHWYTCIFNFGRKEVSNFLIANAHFWFDKMHIDGLRVDAVASMLYLDYGRENEEWIPNQYGGKENLEAIEFIKHLNAVVHQRFPGVLTIAEESTAFTGVTHSVDQGGLGFDLKWNMGWMNDTLRYFSKDMIFRHYHHHDLTFGLLYAFSEKFALVLSHDEVVHGKNSLMGRMPGDFWQKFANMRLLYSYMVCQPGKKLLFMGGEIGQWNEWNCGREVEWFLTSFPPHYGIQTLVKEINDFYYNHSCLWERDFDYTGFQWIDFSDTKNSVVSYLRKSPQETLLCVHNFTPSYIENYELIVGKVMQIQEVFNTDDEKYWGSGKVNKQPKILYGENNCPYGVKFQLAPLSTMIFQLNF